MYQASATRSYSPKTKANSCYTSWEINSVPHFCLVERFAVKFNNLFLFEYLFVNMKLKVMTTWEKLYMRNISIFTSDKLQANCTQVDRDTFPCGCANHGCHNSVGKIQFDTHRVKTHYDQVLHRKNDTKGTFAGSRKNNDFLLFCSDLYFWLFE